MKSNSNYENILKFGNGKINKSDIEKAQKGDTSSLLDALSPEDRKKVTDALNNKEKLREVLSSDTAQKLLKMLGGK